MGTSVVSRQWGIDEEARTTRNNALSPRNVDPASSIRRGPEAALAEVFVVDNSILVLDNVLLEHLRKIRRE